MLTGPGVLDKTMLGVIWTIAFIYGCLSEQILSQVFPIYFQMRMATLANPSVRQQLSLTVTIGYLLQYQYSCVHVYSQQIFLFVHIIDYYQRDRATRGFPNLVHFLMNLRRWTCPARSVTLRGPGWASPAFSSPSSSPSSSAPSSPASSIACSRSYSESRG